MTVPASVLRDLPEQDYAAIRALVRTGDLMLCSGTAPFSRVIQWATASPWSHIAMIVRLGDLDRVMVCEAVAKIGVRVVPLSRFLTGGTPRHPKPFAGTAIVARHADFDAHAADGALRKLDDFAFDRLGSPFSAAEIAKIGFRIFLGPFGVKIPRMASAGRRILLLGISRGMLQAHRHRRAVGRTRLHRAGRFRGRSQGERARTGCAPAVRFR